MEKYQKQIRNALIVIAVILACAVLKVTSTVSINLLLAVFIFFLCYPLLHAMDRAKFPSWLSLTLTILLIVIVIVLSFGFFIYTIDILLRTLPGYSSRLEEIEKFVISLVGRFVKIPEGYSFLMNIDWISSVVIPALKAASSSVLTLIKNGFVVLLMAVFLLLERNTIVPKFEKAAAEDNKGRVASIWDRINRQISKYLGLKLLISAATGVCFYIIAKLVKLDFASIWGVLAFILNFIPTFGSIIITCLTIAMAVLQFVPHITPILIVAAGTIATQMILGNIIDPRLQGNQLNLSPFVILVALSFFGFIFGIVGMFLAVPLLSILEIVLANMDGTKGIAIILSSNKEKKKRLRNGESADEINDEDSEKDTEETVKTDSKENYENITLPH